MFGRLVAIGALLALALGLIGENASSSPLYPYRVTCEGDSMTRGFDADDNCNDLTACITNAGDDLGYSYCYGYSMSQSLRKKMSSTSSQLKGVNGNDWMHNAASQTNSTISSGGAHTVSIGLGGNDLLINLGGTLASKSDFRTKVRAALHTLVYATSSKRPANVVLMSIPDVVNLYNIMHNHKNFAFETCQGMYDDFSGKISSSLKVCEPHWWNPLSWLCGIANLLQKWTNWVNAVKDVMVWAVDVFGNAKFPGGYILNSKAPASNRTLAAARRNDFNTVLREEAANYNGINGVRVVYAPSLANYAFDPSLVSKLDCFHPNRNGQKVIADLLWNDVNQSVYKIGTYGGSTGAGSDVGVPTDTVAPKIASGWSGGWTSDWTVLHQAVSSVKGSSSDMSGDYASLDIWAQNYGYDGAYACTSGAGCFVGTLRESAVNHTYGIAFHDPYGNADPAGYYDYWRTWVRPKDVKGNGSTLYAGPWF